MRIVALQDRLVGETLAMPIHGDGGRLMLGKNVRLTPGIIESLKKRGYTRVAIEDQMMNDVEADEVLQEETRLVTVKALSGVTNSILQGTPGDLQPVRQALDAIMEEIRQNPNAMIALYSLCSFDENIYGHSINTCVLSLAIAGDMGLPEATLRQVGIGALLHDVGKVLVPKTILNKPASLTDEEYGLVKTHTSKGFEMLQTCYNVGTVTAHAALDHHERLDGSGYPRQVKGDNISLIGRIIAVADVYEAMVSPRPQRRAHLPDYVQTYMVQNKCTLFDPDAVDAMLRRVAAYPNGLILSLWGGYVAVVVRQDPRCNTRPVVRIVGGPGVSGVQDICLYDRPELKVNMVLDDYPPEARRIIFTEEAATDIL